MGKMIRVSDELQFSLSNGRISYIFRVSPEGILEHIHFGRALDADHMLPAGPRRAFRCTTPAFQGIDNYNLSDTPQEYPVFGTSDMRQPALHVVNADGNSISTLLYQSHRITDGKPDLPGLPGARDGDCASLVVLLLDEVTKLQVELYYTIFAEHDVIARSVRISNTGDASLELLNACSTTLDFPAEDYELLHFKGTWAREFNEHRTPVPAGRFSIDAASGTSGNLHSPFLALLQPGATEEHGEVYATTLMYSGNFTISVEKGEFDAVRLTAGLNSFNFRWRLEPGESFHCPEALHVFSSRGLDGMSQAWHAFIRDKISPPQFSGVARPTYLNSWEAAYFDVNEDVVLDLAEQAKSLGLEMLVVDDGWFQGRNDDTSSLGDWVADKTKFPNGIESVAAKVREKGLKFGLWFEPEMVNENSRLYREHPDWVIHVPHRTLSTGRQQLVLDLSRTDVVEYLYQCIDTLLSCGQIDYVKWDMNRVMTEIGSAALPPERQLETPHRYMLGLYDLLSRLTGKHTNVLFENCASGGNRLDLGMLRYMSQTWVSDMSEPVGRLPIINGASHLFPPSVMASYIGPVPSHQNNRMVSVKLRTEVGFFCAARGLSLNAADIEEHHQDLQGAAQLYAQTAADLASARFHRLRFTGNEVCWQLTTQDGGRVYLGYFHILSAPNLPYQRVRLRGLDSSSEYHIRGSGLSYKGDSLMHLGFDLPYVHAMQLDDGTDYMDRGDFASRLWVFERKYS